MGSSTPFVFQAMVDLLERSEPRRLEDLRRRYPAYADSLTAGKKLGNEGIADSGLLIELALSTIDIAKGEATRVSDRVSNKMRLSSRLRLFGAIVTAISSAGLLAALTQGSSHAAVLGGLVALASSCFTLVAQYIEDFVGGQNSLRELRNRISDDTTQVLKADGELKLMAALHKFDGLESLVRGLNSAIADLRQADYILK